MDSLLKKIEKEQENHRICLNGYLLCLYLEPDSLSRAYVKLFLLSRCKISCILQFCGGKFCLHTFFWIIFGTGFS